MRKAYLIGAAALVLAAGGLIALKQSGAAPAKPGETRLADDLGRLGVGVGDAWLVDAHGNRVRWSSLAGRPRALFFGFTHCPVVCPVTVWELNNAAELIGPASDALQIQFVTLDPERDTPEAMAKYFSGFEGRIDAYSGARSDIDRIARAFEVTHRRVDEEGGQYTIDHTATVFLLDARGVVVDVVAYGTPPDILQARLRSLLAR